MAVVGLVNRLTDPVVKRLASTSSLSVQMALLATPRPVATIPTVISTSRMRVR
jgi:hypothetical protein